MSFEGDIVGVTRVFEICNRSKTCSGSRYAPHTSFVRLDKPADNILGAEKPIAWTAVLFGAPSALEQWTLNLRIETGKLRIRSGSVTTVYGFRGRIMMTRSAWWDACNGWLAFSRYLSLMRWLVGRGMTRNELVVIIIDYLAFPGNWQEKRRWGRTNEWRIISLTISWAVCRVAAMRGQAGASGDPDGRWQWRERRRGREKVIVCLRHKHCYVLNQLRSHLPPVAVAVLYFLRSSLNLQGFHYSTAFNLY